MDTTPETTPPARVRARGRHGPVGWTVAIALVLLGALMLSYVCWIVGFLIFCTPYGSDGPVILDACAHASATLDPAAPHPGDGILQGCTGGGLS